jgi:phosphoglycolate phosphatase
VLWDVDGTIVDASDGILRRLTITLEHFGRTAPTRAELVHWIGPPMFESFQVTAGMSPDQAAEVRSLLVGGETLQDLAGRARVTLGSVP